MAVPEEIQEKALAEATSATPDYSTDYSDERFDKSDALYQQGQDRLDVYQDMIDNTDSVYDNLKNTIQQNADKQAQIQQDNTDFAIEMIEQQKEQAHKDYLKEQSAAYVDWQKQSNQYGTQAEKIASAGLTNTGYSESSQVAMYNQYQNRVAMAKESLEQAKLNYNNNIQEAMLQNSAALAEIYSSAAIKQVELAINQMQYKNQLIENLVNRQEQLEAEKWQREQDIIAQQNWEKQMAEEYRQFEDSQKFTAEQNQIQRDWEAQQADIDRVFQKELKRIDQEFTAAQNKLDRDHDFALLKAETEEEKKRIDYQYEIDKQKLADQTAAQKEVLKYQADLEKAEITGGTTKAYQGSSSHRGNGGTGKTYTYNTKSSGTTIKSTGSLPISSITDENMARSYMKAKGVSSATINRLRSMQEWSRSRNFYLSGGKGSFSAEITQCKTYQEYLQYFCRYATNQ